MSTALVILPRVWGMAAIGTAAQALETARSSARTGARKGPHRLRLVASAGTLTMASPVAALRLVEAPPAPEMPRAVKTPVAVRRVDPELAFYRKYTEALLRRYVKLSMEAGRTPSLLGQEMFRGKVTSYRVRSFEDVVIFVHDVEKCLERLDGAQKHLVRRIAMEQYTQGETAAMLGVSLRTVVRRYGEALDKLTRVLLKRGLMEPLGAGRAAD